MSDFKKTKVNSGFRYEITQVDLPLSCPTPDKTLWNAHPRVFLAIEKTGESVCPYCGILYILKDFSKV